MSDVKTISDLILFDAHRNNAIEMLQADPAVYRINQNHVVKILPYSDAMDHHMNRRLMQATGMNTVDTAVLKLSQQTYGALCPDLKDRDISKNPYALVMTYVEGERFADHAAILSKRARTNLMKAFATDLLAQCVLISYTDPHDYNTFANGRKIIVIDYERALASGWNVYPEKLFENLRETEDCPYFHLDFDYSKLIDAADTAKNNVMTVTNQRANRSLRGYQPVIATRHKFFVDYLKKQRKF